MSDYNNKVICDLKEIASDVEYLPVELNGKYSKPNLLVQNFMLNKDFAEFLNNGSGKLLSNLIQLFDVLPISLRTDHFMHEFVLSWLSKHFSEDVQQLTKDILALEKGRDVIALEIEKKRKELALKVNSETALKLSKMVKHN